ncbi:MAG: hypothetical protein AAFX90_19475 [Pseudomonadota bacterium]
MAHVPVALQRYHESHYSGGYISWFHYATTHTSAEVQAANFFNDSVDTLRVGDIVEAIVDADGTPAFLRLRVATNDGTNVTVSAL